MEALSKIQETERILQFLDDETSLLKETLGENERDLSEFETLEARNKEALALIHDLEAQVESLNQENVQLKDMVDEKESFQEKLVLVENENSELKKKVRDQEDVISSLRGGEGKSDKGQIQLALIHDLEAQVESLNEENIQLKEMVDERESFQEKLILVENENTKLKKRVRDQEDVICGLKGGEGKSVKGQIQLAFERKVEEMGKEFRQDIEANITIMRQRIRVAEQVQTEIIENFKRTKEKCELEHFGVGKKVQGYSQMFVTSKKEVTNLFDKANESLFGLESLFERYGAKEAEFLGRISRIGDEIIVMKDWIKAKREEEEDLRLVRKMERLHKRMNELEKSAEVKEETIFELVEEKKEAIRQLSFCIEYHQNRCDELLKSLSNRTS